MTAAGVSRHHRYWQSGRFPYADYSRQGATIVPRCFFFVEETANTAIVQAAPTVTVNPRRGNLDKAPWKDLDLTAITGQTVENRHLFDVHLGETIAPYVALEPLKALLPLKRGEAAISPMATAPAASGWEGWNGGCESAGGRSAVCGRTTKHLPTD